MCTNRWDWLSNKGRSGCHKEVGEVGVVGVVAKWDETEE